MSQSNATKILVIDDEPLILKIIKKFVHKMFGEDQSIEAKTGVEGIKIFSENPERFRVCIIDYHLPDIQCKELIQKIKELNPKVKIILSTGSMAKDLGDVPEVGSFLQKPFTFKEFKKKLSELEIIKV